MKETKFACRLALFIFFSVALNPLNPSYAYDLFTHHRVVIDAFEFMLNEKATVYPDGHTAAADYELLRSVFSPSTTNEAATRAAILAAADELGKASERTDLFEDVKLDLWIFGPFFKCP